MHSHAAGLLLDFRFAPIAVLRAQPCGFELPGGSVKRLSDFEPAMRGHLADEVGLDGFGGGHGKPEKRKGEIHAVITP